MKQKSKAKKLGHLLVKGAKETGKFVGKYGPKAHAFSKSIAESTMDVMVPRRTRTVVDLTAKRKPKRIVKGKGGFYLDFS